MPVLNVGLNRVRDIIVDDITDALAGTSNATVVLTQTNLQSPVAATERDVTTTKSERAFQTTQLIPSTIATNNTFREFSVRMNSDAITLSRAVTAPIVHTSNDEITKITTFVLRDA